MDVDAVGEWLRSLKLRGNVEQYVQVRDGVWMAGLGVKERVTVPVRRGALSMFCCYVNNDARFGNLCRHSGTMVSTGNAS